jgi:hypothetical protein
LLCLGFIALCLFGATGSESFCGGIRSVLFVLIGPLARALEQRLTFVVTRSGRASGPGLARGSDVFRLCGHE